MVVRPKTVVPVDPLPPPPPPEKPLEFAPDVDDEVVSDDPLVGVVEPPTPEPVGPVVSLEPMDEGELPAPVDWAPEPGVAVELPPVALPPEVDPDDDPVAPPAEVPPPPPAAGAALIC